MVFPQSDVINSLSVDVSGGKQGDYGDSGKPGLRGGFGYRVFATGRYDRNGELIMGHSPLPPTGQAPVTPTPVNDNVRGGKSGSVFYKPFDTDYNYYIPVEYAKLLLLKAESEYLNNRGELTECIEVLNYLLQIAIDPGAGLSGDSQATGCPSVYLAAYSTNLVAWEDIRMKALSYLSQIDLGLDIFGNPLNYAPNLNPAFLQTEYAQISGLIDGFEEFVINLIEGQQNLQIAQTGRLIAIQQYDQMIAAYQKQIDKCKLDIVSLNSEIQNRLVIIEQLKQRLLVDDASFRQAVYEQSSGCQLVDVIHFVTAAITIASAVYTLGATGAAAVGAIGDIVSGIRAVDSFEILKVALSSEGIISGGIKDLRKDIQAATNEIKVIKDTYTDLASAHENVPKSLLALEKENFDKTIDKFLNLPAARQYKKDYHNFIDYAQLTNEKREELTSLVLRVNALYRSLQTAVSEQNIIKGDFDHVLDKAISLRAKQAILSLYYQTKWNVIRQIYLQDKAIAYQNPESGSSYRNYDDYNIKTLKADIFNINVQYINSLSGHQFQAGGSLQPYSISLINSTGPNPIMGAFVAAFLTGEEGADGQRNHVLDFNIKTVLLDMSDPSSQQRIAFLKGIFTNIKNIKAVGIKAVFNCNQNIAGQIVFRITQMGNSTVTTSADFQGPVKFRHQKVIANPITSTLTINNGFTGFSNSDKTNLTGLEPGSGRIYMAGVSPFASWKLEVSEAENPGQNLEEVLDKVVSIDLYFWYTYENA